MAQQGVDPDQDRLLCCCSICLDPLKEPVTLPCGHSYCRTCIEGCWDRDEETTGVCSCPQCREDFTPRPTLRKNNMLAEVVEKLMNTGGRQSSSASADVVDHAAAGPEDVACDFCAGTRRRKALVSCLTCLASYCETHLQPHDTVPTWKRHTLVPATSKLQDRMCSGHGKLMEVYCRTDQRCICLLCTVDEHKGHDTVSAAAERTDKQKHLVVSQQNVQQKIGKRKKELKDLKRVIMTLKSSAQAAVDASDKIFSEIMVSMERRSSEVQELIRAQESTALAQTEGLLRQLEEEVALLERRRAEMEELSSTEDTIHFIQSFQSLSSSSGPPELPRIAVRPVRPYFTDVTDAVSGLKDHLNDILRKTWPEISARVSAVDVFHPPEPQTRNDFLQYSCPLSLDLNTVHSCMSLSNENREVTADIQALEPYPDHPERFTDICQVLCTEGLSDRCYLEVQWSGIKVSIAVSYKDIDRKGIKEGFGSNDKSWMVQYSGEGCVFKHNNVETKVPGALSSRVGVYLDHKAGTLSFYSVSDKMSLIHKVQTKFTQPLYPGIWLYYVGDKAEVCKTW